MASLADRWRAMLACRVAGYVTCDYGNHLRAQAKQAGVSNAFDFPGFGPACMRPLFCEGKGPFRWAVIAHSQSKNERLADARPSRSIAAHRARLNVVRWDLAVISARGVNRPLPAIADVYRLARATPFDEQG